MKHLEPSDLVGKTIQSAEFITAEFGRTYEGYLCLVFTDGTKQMIAVTSNGLNLYNPNPPSNTPLSVPSGLFRRQFSPC